MKLKLIAFIIPFLICSISLSADTLYKNVLNKIEIKVDSNTYTAGLIELKENSIRIVDKNNSVSEIPVESIYSINIKGKKGVFKGAGTGFLISYGIAMVAGYVAILAGDKGENPSIVGPVMPIISIPFGIVGAIIGATTGAFSTTPFLINYSQENYNLNKDALSKFIKFRRI